MADAAGATVFGHLEQEFEQAAQALRSRRIGRRERWRRGIRIRQGIDK